MSYVASGSPGERAANVSAPPSALSIFILGVALHFAVDAKAPAKRLSVLSGSATASGAFESALHTSPVVPCGTLKRRNTQPSVRPGSAVTFNGVLPFLESALTANPEPGITPARDTSLLVDTSTSYGSVTSQRLFHSRANSGADLPHTADLARFCVSAGKATHVQHVELSQGYTDIWSRAVFAPDWLGYFTIRRLRPGLAGMFTVKDFSGNRSPFRKATARRVQFGAVHRNMVTVSYTHLTLPTN